MKNHSRLLLLAISMAAYANAGAVDSLAGLSWLKDLAGSCWSTTLPDGKTDTQCYETRFGRFLYGTVRIAAAANKAAAPVAGLHSAGFEGESVFAWDDKNKKITFWFWANDGSFGQGEGFVEGELIHFPAFNKVDPSKPRSRSTWKRIDADSYRVGRQQKEGESWNEKWAVVYKRRP